MFSATNAAGEFKGSRWVIQNGIELTSMPAWVARLDEQQIWDVTAFVKQLPKLSPTDYRQWDRQLSQAAAQPRSSGTVVERPGNPAAGRRAVQLYLCVTCHKIPGIAGGNNTVGPSLNGIANRSYIGGSLENRPDNMVRCQAATVVSDAPSGEAAWSGFRVRHPAKP